MSKPDTPTTDPKPTLAAYDPEWVSSLILTPDRIQRYPRASQYDPEWLYKNQRGSHCLWLMEALCQKMELRPGMRVLDLGCGKVIEAIFLAKEYGVTVWAVDQEANPTENWERVCQAGVQDRVIPLRGDARNLPFPDEFFDAVIGINILQYFGTDDLYLSTRLVKTIHPGGQIGMVVPGLYHEFPDDEVPEYLQPHWDPLFFSWHSPVWWQRLWTKTGLVEVQTADTFDDGEGYTIFVTWETAVKSPHAMVKVDGGRNITFVRLVATKINDAWS